MFRGQDGSQGRKRLAGPQLQASRSVSSSLSTVADRESYCFSCWAVTERNCSVLSLCYQKLCLKKKNQHRGGDWVLRAHLSCCTPSCDPGPPNCPWRIKVDSKTAKPRALFQVGGEGSFRSFNSRSGWWKKRLERSGRLESPASAFSLSECKVPLKLVGWHEFLSSLFLFLFLSFFPYLFSSFLSKGKPNRSQDLCTASGKNVLNVSLTAHRSFQISSGWDSST